MQDAKMRAAVIAIVLLGMIGGGAGLYGSRHAAVAPIVVTGALPAALTTTAVVRHDAPAPVSVQVEKPAPVRPVLLYVHVAGAVKNPSLYQLAPDSRVMHAIKAAGGPTGKADLDAVNLAEKVRDGEKIYVPTKASVQAAAVPESVLASSEAVSPAAPIEVSNTARAAVRKPGKPAAGGGKPGKLISPSQGQVNINTASAEQLQELPGIGPAMAGRILGYRQQAGGFQKTDDLMNVGGIGPKKYARIAPLVRLH